MLFCRSIAEIAFCTSAEVAVMFLRFASSICSRSSIKVRNTCAARRWRACGVSGMAVDSRIILMREARSATEITSSLTTAAMRISGYGPVGGRDAGGSGARGEAAPAGVNTPTRPPKTHKITQNQRIVFIDRQLLRRQ